nr:hypothetical protein [Psychrobacter sp. PraFG1]UNK04876.1 hypothetical protein MN210_12115 [Psychrobacter sp. PraFG1]
MKVMRLLSSLKHDESERGIFHLGRALVKRGHTSIIISSADKEHDLVKRLERDGNIYNQLSLEKSLGWRYAKCCRFAGLLRSISRILFISIHARRFDIALGVKRRQG